MKLTHFVVALFLITSGLRLAVHAADNDTASNPLLAGSEVLSPELEALRFWTGEWTVDVEMFPSAYMPEGKKTTAKHTLDYHLGGKFLRLRAEGPDTYKGLVLIGWSRGKDGGSYEAHWFDNHGITAKTSGKWLEEGKLLQFSGEYDFMEQHFVERQTLTRNEDGTVEFIVELKDGEGNWKKTMASVYRKAK